METCNYLIKCCEDLINPDDFQITVTHLHLATNEPVFHDGVCEMHYIMNQVVQQKETTTF